MTNNNFSDKTVNLVNIFSKLLNGKSSIYFRDGLFCCETKQYYAETFVTEEGLQNHLEEKCKILLEEKKKELEEIEKILGCSTPINFNFFYSFFEDQNEFSVKLYQNFSFLQKDTEKFDSIGNITISLDKERITNENVNSKPYFAKIVRAKK
jgi:hypothetical protein